MNAQLAPLKPTTRPPQKYRWPLDLKLHVDLERADFPRIITLCPEASIRGITWLMDRATIAVELFTAPDYHLLRVRMAMQTSRSVIAGEGAPFPRGVRYARELHWTAWDAEIFFIVSALRWLDVLTARRLTAKARLMRGVKLAFAEENKPKAFRLFAERPLTIRDLATE